MTLPGRLLPRSFYEMRPEVVAPRLLGKILVHEAGGVRMAGRIVEAEAYLGPHNDPPDPAAHSHRGPTPRNRVLFGPPGFAYVYSIYGKYYCLNISCEREGEAGCVLLRALEPVAGLEQMAVNRGLPPHFWGTEKSLPGPQRRGTGGTLGGVDRVLRQLTTGPSRMCQALGVARESHNGLDVTREGSALQVRDDGFRVEEAVATARIGINERNAAVDWPLRFAIPGNGFVSGPKNLAGKRVRVP